jgi:6-phosphogluconate dehydrogenase
MNMIYLFLIFFINSKEYSCAMYNKDYSSLDDFVDDEARQKALAQVKVFF